MATADTVQETEETPTLPDAIRTEISAMIGEAVNPLADTVAQLAATVAQLTAGLPNLISTAIASSVAAQGPTNRALAQSMGLTDDEVLPPLDVAQRDRALEICRNRWPGYLSYELHPEKDEIVSINKKHQRCRWNCRRVLRDAEAHPPFGEPIKPIRPGMLPSLPSLPSLE